MRLTSKDVIAVVLVAAVAVPYVGFLIDGSMPFIQDARGMSAVGLLLGAAAFLVFRSGDPLDRIGKLELALAGAALAIGITALLLAETTAAAAWLAAFMIALLVVVLVELTDHLGVLPGRDTARAA